MRLGTRYYSNETPYHRDPGDLQMKEIGSQPLDMTELHGFMGMSREKRLAI
jgi:hypothetical protein